MKNLLCLLLGFTTSLHAAKPFVPNLGPDLPTITVPCGEVSLLLRQASQCTAGAAGCVFTNTHHTPAPPRKTTFSIRAFGFMRKPWGMAIFETHLASQAGGKFFDSGPYVCETMKPLACEV